MSGFRKKAVLKRAMDFGLDPVAETPPPARLCEPRPAPGPGAAATETPPPAAAASRAAKAALFPVQAAYTDPATGVCFNTYYAPAGSPAAPLYVCHHGAGSSAMTFWCLARQLRDLAEGDDVPGVFAFDARGHGDTCPPGLRYTLADFAGDFAFVMREFCERHRPGNPVCLVGHSLGGAVLTEFVARFPDLDCNVRGLVVVDVVEDTAVRSLLQMAVFLHKRPRAFGSYGQAIRWHLQTRLLRNEESARVSVPELLVRGPGGGLVWKASLLDMAPSWHTWFDGLSRKFLACRLTKQSLAKMLVLSSSETLDKGLTIGQMQGRFQLVVFNNSTNAGHFLHEDIPRQVAATLSEFMRRLCGSHAQSRQRSIALWGGQIHT